MDVILIIFNNLAVTVSKVSVSRCLFTLEIHNVHHSRKVSVNQRKGNGYLWLPLKVFTVGSRCGGEGCQLQTGNKVGIVWIPTCQIIWLQSNQMFPLGPASLPRGQCWDISLKQTYILYFH